MALPEILPDEEIAQAPWGVVRTDLAGVVQVLRGHGGFAHAENGNRYDGAFWNERSTDQDRAQAPHLVFKVVVNHVNNDEYHDQSQRVYSTVINRNAIQIESTIQSPPKDLVAIKDEARARTYQTHQGVLSETDHIVLHDQERTDRTKPVWVTAERNTLWNLYDTAFAEIDAALSSADIQNAESDYVTQVRSAVGLRPENLWEDAAALRGR